MHQPIRHKLSVKQGFTLIEILIVIVIIGIVTATALYAIGDGGRGRRVQAAATQLHNALELAQQQAMLTESVLGLEIDEHAYQFFQFVLTTDASNIPIQAQWLPLRGNPVLAKQNLPNYIHLAVTVPSSPFQATQEKLAVAATHHPQLLIFPDSSFTAFTLEITGDKGKPRYTLTGDSAGNFK